MRGGIRRTVLCQGKGELGWLLRATRLEIARDAVMARVGGRPAQASALPGLLRLGGWAVCQGGEVGDRRLRSEVTGLHEEVTMPLEGGRTPRAGTPRASGVRVQGQVAPGLKHHVRIGVLEELSPAASVAHGEEGTGGWGTSHGVVVLVRADCMHVEPRLQSKGDEMTDKRILLGRFELED